MPQNANVRITLARENFTLRSPQFVFRGVARDFSNIDRGPVVKLSLAQPIIHTEQIAGPFQLVIKPYQQFKFRLGRGERGPAGVGLQEVFYQDIDPPGVTYPAINFAGGYFPAHPEIPVMKVFKP